MPTQPNRYANRKKQEKLAQAEKANAALQAEFCGASTQTEVAAATSQEFRGATTATVEVKSPSIKTPSKVALFQFPEIPKPTEAPAAEKPVDTRYAWNPTRLLW